PWCVKKCPYCDFNSHVSSNKITDKQYCQALILELEKKLPDIWGRRLLSIFIGGGTPSLIQPESLDKLLVNIRALLPFSPNIEITLEANPGTVDATKFTEFKALGINRLSIGIQSFQDNLLNQIGRIHSGQEAKKAIEISKQAGFDNINLDFIFALPQQTLKLLIDDLKCAIEFQPNHLSFYQLTIEPNTLFASKPPPLPVDDDVYEFFQIGQQYLHDNKFLQYETSAYAKTGKQCQHNLNYWQFGDYLGIGAGAHSKITHCQQQQIIRHWNHKNPAEYINQQSHKQVDNHQRILTKSDLILEFMMNTLRLKEGFNYSYFEDRTGLLKTDILPALQIAKDNKWIETRNSTIKATQQGERFLNDLLLLFMTEK
ncbi:MAG: radical SAM family heme chaperone HemW, partial [Methylococcales bacterium]|nr:radical SAM family heme chaperone HemW [Methylococcales bacterium]